MTLIVKFVLFGSLATSLVSCAFKFVTILKMADKRWVEHVKWDQVEKLTSKTKDCD